MPVYDYKCASHGLFHDLATMENSARPARCPKCGGASPRVIMIPPAILDMAPDKKAAGNRNEKARHEPLVSATDSRQEARERERHRHDNRLKGCGCHTEREQSALKQQVVLLPDGSKVFPSQRPWMISH
jgi:putative FmdB family regulatory protein